jgi:hypothetical protein
MPNDIQVKLGNVALGTNNHPRGKTPKLESVGHDPDERFFMLATFCFDLSRKLKYISLALSDFYGNAEDAFKERILRDERFINPKPDILPWEAMAVRAEKVMRDLHDELVNEYGYPPYPPAE